MDSLVYDWDHSIEDELQNYKQLYFYNTASDSAVQARTYEHVSAIPVGVGDGLRIGRKVMIKGYLLTFAIRPIAASPTAEFGTLLRASLFYDSQSGSAPPSDMWVVNSSDEAVYSPINTSYRNRFTFLEDIMFNCTAYTIPVATLTTGTTGWQSAVRSGKCELPLIFSTTSTPTTGRLTLAYNASITTMYVKWGVRIFYEDS